MAHRSVIAVNTIEPKKEEACIEGEKSTISILFEYFWMAEFGYAILFVITAPISLAIKDFSSMRWDVNTNWFLAPAWLRDPKYMFDYSVFQNYYPYSLYPKILNFTA